MNSFVIFLYDGVNVLEMGTTRHLMQEPHIVKLLCVLISLVIIQSA